MRSLALCLVFLHVAAAAPAVKLVSPVDGESFFSEEDHAQVQVVFKVRDFEMGEGKGCASLTVDGVEHSFAPREGAYSLSVPPGAHKVAVVLLEECLDDIGVSAAANVNVNIKSFSGDAIASNVDGQEDAASNMAATGSVQKIRMWAGKKSSPETSMVIRYESGIAPNPGLSFILNLNGKDTLERHDPSGMFDLSNPPSGEYVLSVVGSLDGKVMGIGNLTLTWTFGPKAPANGAFLKQPEFDASPQGEADRREQARKEAQRNYNVGPRETIASPTPNKPRVMILFPREGQELVRGVERTAVTYAVDGVKNSGELWCRILVNGNMAALPEVVPKKTNPNFYDEYYVDLEGRILGPTDVEIFLEDKDGNRLEDPAASADVTFDVVEDVPETFDSSNPLTPHCPPNVFGANCDHNMRRQTEYLPPARSSGDPALAAIANTMFRSVQTLLDNADCKESTVVAEIPSSGLGAQMLFLCLALTKAYRTNQGMVAVGNWLYGMHSGCPGGGLGCVFANSFSCPDHPNPSPSSISEPENFEAPEEFAKFGSFWWRAHLLTMIMHPRDEMVSRLLTAKRALGWPRHAPVVAVHVRHGDWCTDVYQMNLHHGTLQPCHPFSTYLAAVRKLKELYGVRVAYLSTNDEKVVAEAKEVRDIKFLSVEFDRSQFASRWGLEQMMMHGTVDRKTVAESALVDLLLLRECDYFVGGFKSQFARVAVALMAARTGELPPYVSVDNPWFAHDQIYLMLTRYSYKLEVEEITQHLVQADWDMDVADASLARRVAEKNQEGK